MLLSFVAAETIEPGSGKSPMRGVDSGVQCLWLGFELTDKTLFRVSSRLS